MGIADDIIKNRKNESIADLIIKNKINVSENTTKNITNISAKDKQAIYKKNEQELFKQSDILKNKYTQNNVKINKSGLLPTADKKTYLQDGTPVYYNKNYHQLTEENKNHKIVEIDKKSKENLQKFNDLKNTDEVKDLTKKVEKAYDETANSYYDYLKQKVAEDDIGIIDKTIGMAWDGIKAPLTIGKYSLKNDKGESYIMPTYGDLKQQKILENYDTGFGKIVGGSLYELGRQGTSLALNTLVPGSGTTAYFGSMFNDSWNNAIKEGYDDKTSLVYATLGTGLEIATGKFLGGTTKAIFGTGSSNLSSTIGAGLSKLIKNHPKIVNALSNAIAEGGEEFIQEFIDKVNRKIVLDKNTKVISKETFEDALYSAAVGAITGGVGGFIDSNNSNVPENYNVQNNNPKINLPNINKQSNINLPLKNSTQSQNDIRLNTEMQTTDNNFQNSQINNISKPKSAEQLNLEKQINNAIFDSQSNSKSYLGKVTSYVADKIQKITGIDVQNRKHVLTNNDIRHMLKQHGNQDTEALKGQIAITPLDIENIPDIISNPSDIVKGTNNKQGQTIRYIKRYNDNSTYVVEVVPDKSNALIIKTMWKKPSTLTNSITTPSSTPEAKGSDISSTLIDNNITQLDENVKLPSINNMKENANNIPLLPNSNNIRTSTKDSELPIQRDEKTMLPKDPTKESSYETDDLDVAKIAKILDSKPQTEQQKEYKLKTWATINLIDKGYYIDKVARQYKNRELSSKYDYQLLHNGIANQIIGKGRYDNNGNKIGKSLYEIFEPIENANLVKEFSEYMYHQHNIDRMNLTNTHSEDNKPVFGAPITSEASTKVVEELLEKYPEFEHWAEDIYAYNKANLQMLVDNGVITQGDMDYYNKKYPHYVPIVRDNTNLKNGISFVGNKASVGVPIKKAKGGSSNLLPLKDAMSIRTMQTTNSALKNDFGMELLNTLYSEEAIKQMQEVKNVDNVIDEMENTEILTKATKDSDATFTIYLNGQKITMPISNEIYEALAPRNVKSFKVLNNLNNIRRALLTEYNPAFMVTNPIKDLQDGSINSKHPALFTKKLPEAIAQITTKGKVLDLYLANGGGQDTYFNYDKGTEHDNGKKYVKTGNKIIDTLKLPLKVLDGISSINQKIEMAPRLAEFMASLEAGDSIQTAMYNAQEITTNFKRGGDVAKMLDKNGFTFLNAGIQGATKQVRNFQDAKLNGLRGIANLAVKFTVWGLGFGILNDLIWGDDEEYEELQDYVKNNYYIIGKYGDGNFVRIPKGRVVSVIQKLFEDAGNVVTGKEVNGKETLSLIQNQILPSDPSESNLLSPLLQAFGSENGIAWYGGDLIPSRLQNLPEEEQYDESTDKLSIWLGEKLGISPYKINYVLDQYSGVIGDMILPYLTEEAESTTGVLAPLKDKFTVDSTMKSQYVTGFYELKDKLQANSNSYKSATEDKLKYKYINTINSQMSKLYAEKRETQVSDMNNKEKYAKVKEIQEQINQLAKNGLENYDDVTSYDNYAKVADKEYFLNSKNEWEKISDEEIEEVKKLNLNDSQKSDYYKTKVQIGKISSNKNITSEERHTQIAEELINSSLDENSIINLYTKKYSSEDKLNYIKDLNIPVIEFIKLNSQNIESEYNANTGKIINGSKKDKYIRAVNQLKLSVPQKAILIKMQYSTYKTYDNQIVNYVNKFNITANEKKVLLKAIGFDNYSKDVVNYINSQNITKSEKEKKLKSLGFTIRNGRVYW